jgi:transcriptional regulator with XRE-family HTH domain
VANQQFSTDFNKQVGASLQRHRKAAGWSQADIANQLTLRGLSFQQPTVLKVERGSRPLKFEEAVAIADILGIDLAVLAQQIDDEEVGEAVAQIQRTNLTIARTMKGIEEIHERARKSEEDARQFIERVTAAKREAEQRLRDAGAVQDGEGRWHWRSEDGDVVLRVDGENGE